MVTFLLLGHHCFTVKLNKKTDLIMKKLLFILLSILIIVACGNNDKSRGRSRKEKKERTELTADNTEIENSRAHRFLESRDTPGRENEENSIDNDDATVANSEEEDSIPEVEPAEVEEEPEPTPEPAPEPRPEPEPEPRPATRPTPEPAPQQSSNGDTTGNGGGSSNSRSNSSSSSNSNGDSAGSSSQDSREEARSFLRSSMTAANELMSGKEVDVMTICDRIEFRDDNVYYYYTIDESQVSIATLRSMQDTMRENIRNNLENTAGTDLITDRLEILHGKIVYIYTGNQSGESFRISLQY